jgi:hypothetical protein
MPNARVKALAVAAVNKAPLTPHPNPATKSRAPKNLVNGEQPEPMPNRVNLCKPSNIANGIGNNNEKQTVARSKTMGVASSMWKKSFIKGVAIIPLSRIIPENMSIISKLLMSRVLIFPIPDRDKLTINLEKTICRMDTGAEKMLTIAKRELKIP